MELENYTNKPRPRELNIIASRREYWGPIEIKTCCAGCGGLIVEFENRRGKVFIETLPLAWLKRPRQLAKTLADRGFYILPGLERKFAQWLNRRFGELMARQVEAV